MNYAMLKQFIKLAQQAKERRELKASSEVEQHLVDALTESLIDEIDDELTKPVETPETHQEPVETEEAPAPLEEPEEGLSVDSSASDDLSQLKKHELWALVKERGLQGDLVYSTVTIEQLLEILSA